MDYMKFFILYLLVISGCSFLLRPEKSIQESFSLTPPDYSELKYWAAHPEKKDSADLVPANTDFIDKQEFALADVFFIHPTTHLQRDYWNGNLNNETLNNRTDEGTIKPQASVFNDCCKVFAPRYRQATIYVFLKETDDGKKALDFAYQDVKTAFEYFEKNLNKQRPWILASHSQGTYHAARLLAEVISKSKMRKTMVAAYTLGWPYAASESGFPICNSPEQTGCLINWNTYLWDKRPSRLEGLYKSSICVNPLSWTADNSYIPKELNPGSLPKSFDKILTRIADAKCEEGILWTHKITEDGFPTLELGKNYHLVDFHLYYKSIRENASLRVDTFTKTQNAFFP
jgi:hypothetical protein